jgi:signal transduction histidine kinase
MTPARRTATAYGIATLIAAIALAAAGITARPFGGAYLYIPIVGVFVAALHGGLGPGLLAVALCALGFDFFYLGPPFRFGVGDDEELHRLLGFVVTGGAAAWIAARFREARHEAESARRAAEAAEEEARRTGALQERLVAVVSHDLRNPLGALRGNATLLPRLGPLNERQAVVVARMVRTLDRTDALIRDLLDLARTRNGAVLPVNAVDARVGEVCARVVGEFRDARPGASVTLSVEGEDGAAVDPERIAQVVSNLVSNALDHGRAGGTVPVRVSGLASEVVIQVENDGEAPATAQLFEPFARGTHAGTGLGLGLFLVREIARAHGGSAALRSAAGRTLAEVRLPRRPVARTAPRDRGGEAGPSAAVPRPHGGAAAAR